MGWLAEWEVRSLHFQMDKITASLFAVENGPVEEIDSVMETGENCWYYVLEQTKRERIQCPPGGLAL